MSMNIYIYGQRNIQYQNLNGDWVKDIQTSDRFDSIQTSSEQTYRILKSEDRAAAYEEEVRSSCPKEEVTPIYAEEDIFCVGDAVDYQMRDPAAEHIDSFRSWCQAMKELGYEIKFEMI